MVKWIKRILLAVAALLACLIILASIGVHRARQIPGFYRTYNWDPSQRSIVNQRAVSKLTEAHNLAARAQAGERSAARAATRPSRPPLDPLTLTFTQDEVNAFLHQNIHADPAFKKEVDRYVADPGIYFKDARIILAARVKDMGDSVVAVQFQPSLHPQSKLLIKLADVSVGRLSVPTSLFGWQLDRLRSTVLAHLPKWQQSATMDRFGGSNSATVDAAMGKLLLAILDDHPADPVLFLPVANEKGANVPLQITHLQVSDEQLTITLQPLTPEQRQAAFDQIRKPLQP